MSKTLTLSLNFLYQIQTLTTNFSSSDSSIVSVTPHGLVTAIAVGKAKITSQSLTIVVTVVLAPDGSP